MTFQTSLIGGNRIKDTAEFALNTITWGDDGSAYKYVQAGSALAVGQVVYIDEAGAADLLSNTTAGTHKGHPVGVVTQAFTANDFGFVQILGVTTITVAASAAADTQLATTTTAGTIDDAAGVGTYNIDGVIATVADGGSGGNVAGLITKFPTLALAAN